MKKRLKLHKAFKWKIEETIIFTFGYEVKGQGLTASSYMSHQENVENFRSCRTMTICLTLGLYDPKSYSHGDEID